MPKPVLGMHMGSWDWMVTAHSCMWAQYLSQGTEGAGHRPTLQRKKLRPREGCHVPMATQSWTLPCAS